MNLDLYISGILAKNGTFLVIQVQQHTLFFGRKSAFRLVDNFAGIVTV